MLRLSLRKRDLGRNSLGNILKEKPLKHIISFASKGFFRRSPFEIMLKINHIAQKGVLKISPLERN